MIDVASFESTLLFPGGTVAFVSFMRNRMCQLHARLKEQMPSSRFEQLGKFFDALWEMAEWNDW